MKARISIITALFAGFLVCSCSHKQLVDKSTGHSFNGAYTGEYLNRVAFPIGGIGAGMFCMEGTGAISHVSVKNSPDIYNEPFAFAAVSIRGRENAAKVLEAQVPNWKLFGPGGTSNGASGKNYGLPRFESGSFLPRFPFATLELSDGDMPISATISGWSPFIPTDADNSSLPVGAMEYHFKNTSSSEIEAVFSWNSRNFIANENGSIIQTKGGFTLCNNDSKGETEGFSAFVNDEAAVVDYCWFRGDWFDSQSILWKNIENGKTPANPPVESNAPGASVYVPFTLKPGEEKTIILNFCWYLPDSKLSTCSPDAMPENSGYYRPWYSGKFKNISELISYWSTNYNDLKKKSELFRDAFFSSTLPPEVMEAVSANLTILKSPTILRQTDGRLWAWEGCSDAQGCCAGSCTHVWNYAQSISHLFPSLERTLRETEFKVSQDEKGHQTFRSAIPISEPAHNFYAASDGQLGGIMKVYREWRISGNTEWMKQLYPQVKMSMDYCIEAWDPKHKGYLEEPHHNTYDIEFWGPDGMCTSFYLGALTAMIEMSKETNEPFKKYDSLLLKGKAFVESDLFDGEYFIQKVKWEGLRSADPVQAAKSAMWTSYSPEALELMKSEGPKYQYGKGCLSDGILGMWMARVCGLNEVLDKGKITSHLNSVYKYNLKTDLRDHVNPQRPAYAAGNEGGLLLCTWPKGGELSLPFVYSNEVWTGIEYQVASHLMLNSEVEKGLEIVREARKRYDGRVRNPFNEYECGSWYARAMSSYALLEGLTGISYDAVSKTLNIDSQIGDFTSFISTETGFGTVSLKNGEAFIDVVYGQIDVQKTLVSGIEKKLEKTINH